MADIYFSDFFQVDRGVLAKYGALNVSLVADRPLFLDHFLLFNSRKKVYRELHDQIIRYFRFLRDRSVTGDQMEFLGFTGHLGAASCELLQIARD